MNPDVNTHTNFNLPQPVAEPLPSVAAPEIAASSEALTVAPESRPAAQGMQTVALPPAPSVASPAVDSSQSAANPLSGTTPATANDNDIIEKEWITKVKQVIAQTKADPYQQNQQLAALKADYLQKRYGKTVKLS